MKKRRYSREIALKILYQFEASGRPIQEIIENTFNHEKISEDIKNFVFELVQGTMDHLAEIDSQLSGIAMHWRVERMSAIDRNIIRIALFEINHQQETPVNVIINEAIEISKKYGDSKSFQFVNGILDKAAKEIRKKPELSNVSG